MIENRAVGTNDDPPAQTCATGKESRKKHPFLKKIKIKKKLFKLIKIHRVSRVNRVGQVTPIKLALVYLYQ